MAKGKLKIHTENILPIIKKWLYTEKEIFIRELVSNSCDAITKLRALQGAQEAPATEQELRIDITIHPETKTIVIADSGIGMNQEEVEKYIAQVAFSSAEEFVKKYQSSSSPEQIIGHFGLGFFSAYMVSQKVEIETLSYRENSSPVFWSCDGSSSYQIEQGSRTERGTSITLFVDADNSEFLEKERLRSLLQHYCAFLPYPIYLNAERINNSDPLWLKQPTQCEEKEYLDFYRQLYPMESDPIFWIHLNIDYPFHLQGILYFPKITSRFDWGKSHLKLFCNRVFVSDSCKEILPDFLSMLRGAIDSPDIPLNVSRSTLQTDRTVRQLASHISKKVSDRLLQLRESNPTQYEQVWSDIELVVKLGILQDPKFYEKIKPALIWKKLQSPGFTTVEEYLAAAPEAYKDKIFYASEEKMAAPFLELFKNRGIEILLAASPVDTALISSLEQKLPGTTFQRIDGALDDALLDPSKEKTLLDSDGKTEASKIASYIKKTLSIDLLEVEAKSLASDTLPALLLLDEHFRRLRDQFQLTGKDLHGALPTKRTFVVNTNSNLIHSIYALKDQNPQLAQEMVLHLYDLSLLSQREFHAESFASFITRSIHLLGKIEPTTPAETALTQ